MLVFVHLFVLGGWVGVDLQVAFAWVFTSLPVKIVVSFWFPFNVKRGVQHFEVFGGVNEACASGMNVSMISPSLAPYPILNVTSGASGMNVNMIPPSPPHLPARAQVE